MSFFALSLAFPKLLLLTIISYILTYLIVGFCWSVLYWRYYKSRIKKLSNDWLKENSDQLTISYDGKNELALFRRFWSPDEHHLRYRLWTDAVKDPGRPENTINERAMYKRFVSHLTDVVFLQRTLGIITFKTLVWPVTLIRFFFLEVVNPSCKSIFSVVHTVLFGKPLYRE